MRSRRPVREGDQHGVALVLEQRQPGFNIVKHKKWTNIQGPILLLLNPVPSLIGLAG